MKKNIFMSAIIVISVLYCLAAVSYASGPMFMRMKSAYGSFKDISGRFSQVSSIRDLNKELSFDGTFRIKPPLKMSWKYEGEDEQEVYINDNDLTVYKKKHNQAMRSKIDDAAIAQTPLALLRDMKDIENDYDITEKNNVVRLTPKNNSVKVKYFDVYPSKDAFPIKKIVLFDKNENTVEITIKDVKVNTGLTDEIFQFTLPDGATLVNN